VTPLTTAVWLVLLLIWMRVSTECIFSPLNVAALRTLPEAHVGTGSGVLYVIMGLGAAVGTAGTASLLGHWTCLHSQVAAFKQIFWLISLLYLTTIVPALLIVPSKREQGAGYICTHVYHSRSQSKLSSGHSLA
jgi:MFS family permease